MPGQNIKNTNYSSLPNLTSEQQKLLLSALQSNDRRIPVAELRNTSQSSSNNRIFRTTSNGQSVSQGINPSALDKPTKPNGFVDFQRPTFGEQFLPDMNTGHEIDYDIDLPRNVSESLAGFSHGEFGEKRKISEDAEDDEDGGDLKRGEGDEKTPKKPGRKPVLAEPTTKRKAQNRAAQRAFRERKEKHLSNLENKINDLQQTSQTANQENNILRAQVFRLQSELRDYRKRLSSSGLTGGSPTNIGFTQYQRPISQSGNPFDFSFGSNASFDNFASLPDTSSNSLASNSTADPFTVQIKREPSSRSNSDGSGFDASRSNSTQSATLHDPTQQESPHNNNNASDLFTPGFFGLGNNNYGFPQFGSPAQTQNTVLPQSRQASASLSEQAPSLSSNGASPCSSSNGINSSCGTSPHLDTVDNNQPQNHKDTAFNDLSTFQFNPDPSLFGDYREPQNNILGDGDFSGGLWDDWLNNSHDTTIDLTTSPPADKASTPAPQKQKMSLLDQVAQARNGADDDDLARYPIVPKADKEQREMMTCHKIWQQLQTCPKFQEGTLDIDGLCSELQQKATCSETGATIPKQEWENALYKLVGGKPAGGETST